MPGTEKPPVQAALSLDAQGHSRYVKMKVMKGLTTETIVKFVEENIVEGSVINTTDIGRTGRRLRKAVIRTNPRSLTGRNTRII